MRAIITANLTSFQARPNFGVFFCCGALGLGLILLGAWQLRTSWGRERRSLNAVIVLGLGMLMLLLSGVGIVGAILE